jgi:penicillin-binding protein 1A
MSHSQRNRRRRRGRGKGRSKAMLGLAVVLSLGVLAGLSAVGYVVSIAASAPNLNTLKPRDPGGFSEVFARDGKRLGVIQAEELRKEIRGREIPQVMKDATVAIEDERYYSHKGVDYVGVVRAAVKNLASRDTVQGGSTITMQLVRNLYISNERTYQRKIREAKLAEELENEHPGREGKEWILTKYINTVPYGTVGGQSAIGVWAASKIYFDKSPKDLELHQAALLAGLPQAPDTYSPTRNPEAAKRRRNEVIYKMAELGMISDTQAVEAAGKDLDLDLGDYFTLRREDFFFDYVKDQLFENLEGGAQLVRKGGLRIKTTIDLDMQKAAKQTIANNLAGVGPSSAVVTIDPKNGHILAMASTAEYGKSNFNLAAQGRRQPGSAFKTMALMAALRRGVDPDRTSYRGNSPMKFNDPQFGPPFEIKNYANSQFSGNLTQATLKSVNTVYIQLAMDLGPQQVKQTAHDMGIESPLEAVPAETLGGLKVGVSPLEMANAYATIANGGWRRRPIAITSIRLRDGTVLSGDKLPGKLRPKKTKAFTDGVTYKATEILQKNISSGTGGRAGVIGCPAAGKTGTTDKNSDAWFVGFTPRLSTAVWVGYPKAQVYMQSEFGGGPVDGGTYPAKIWGEYMKIAKGGFCGDFEKPTEPFVATPFFGKYARGGGNVTQGQGDDYTYTNPGTGGSAPQPEQGTGTPGTNGGDGNGGGNGSPPQEEFDPTLYESPPQTAPGNSGNSNGNSGGDGGASPDG